MNSTERATFIQGVRDQLSKGATELSFAGHQPSLDDDAISSLSKLLAGNTTVTKLDLSGNQIGDRGASYLADMLKVNQKLTSLILDGNSIGDKGARALAGVIVDKPQVKSSLRYRAGFWAADAGEECVANRTLRALSLSSNQVSEGIKAEIAQSLERNAPTTQLVAMAAPSLQGPSS